jgi:hypothetical protein
MLERPRDRRSRKSENFTDLKSGNLSDLERRSARERKARHLARRRDGRFVAPVEVTARILDCLIALRYLREADAADARKVGEAIAALVSEVDRK